jgi:hypothetical protein
MRTNLFCVARILPISSSVGRWGRQSAYAPARRARAAAPAHRQRCRHRPGNGRARSRSSPPPAMPARRQHSGLASPSPGSAAEPPRSRRGPSIAVALAPGKHLVRIHIVATSHHRNRCARRERRRDDLTLQYLGPRPIAPTLRRGCVHNRFCGHFSLPRRRRSHQPR